MPTESWCWLRSAIDEERGDMVTIENVPFYTEIQTRGGDGLPLPGISGGSNLSASRP